MTFNKKLLAATLLTAGGFAAMSSANAEDTDFEVNLEVTSICTINAAPALADLTTIQGGQATAAVTTTTAIIVNCSKGDSAIIGLQPQSTPLSANGTGTLLLGGVADAESVAYKLTSVSATGNAWGTTTPVSSAPANSYAEAVSTTIYVTVDDTADVTPGSYSDTVTVSVTY